MKCKIHIKTSEKVLQIIKWCAISGTKEAKKKKTATETNMS